MLAQFFDALESLDRGLTHVPIAVDAGDGSEQALLLDLAYRGLAYIGVIVVERDCAHLRAVA